MGDKRQRKKSQGQSGGCHIEDDKILIAIFMQGIFKG
jgi:hypothetical protein